MNVDLSIHMKQKHLREWRFVKSVRFLLLYIWFIGIVEDVSVENEGALLKFMSPTGPAPSFTWPRHEEICWVPIYRVSCMVEAPCTATSGRTYRIPGHEEFNVERMFKQLKIWKHSVIYRHALYSNSFSILFSVFHSFAIHFTF